MNERIRELAEQTKPLNENGQKVRGLNSEYHDQWMEKFAELIVRECVSMCESVDEADIRYRYDYRRGVLDCADTLRQHFGVE